MEYIAPWEIEKPIAPNTKGCIISPLTKDNEGYARARYNGRLQLHHRVVWTEHNGLIPKGMCICHHCDNPPCINIDHLFLGTHKENMEDMARKGRGRKGNNAYNL